MNSILFTQTIVLLAIFLCFKENKFLNAHAVSSGGLNIEQDENRKADKSEHLYNGKQGTQKINIKNTNNTNYIKII